MTLKYAKQGDLHEILSSNDPYGLVSHAMFAKFRRLNLATLHKNYPTNKKVIVLVRRPGYNAGIQMHASSLLELLLVQDDFEAKVLPVRVCAIRVGLIQVTKDLGIV